MASSAEPKAGTLFLKTEASEHLSQRYLVFLGPPGSGKGTAAAWLASKLNLCHVSMGAIFRHEIAAGTEIGILANKAISGGQLVPDDVVIKVAAAWLQKNKGGFIFDGFPRTLAQAQLFDQLLSDSLLKLDAAVYLQTDYATSEHRILGRLVCEKCGHNFHLTRHPPTQQGLCDFCRAKLSPRDDDTIVLLKQRWLVYERRTAGVREFYRSRGFLVDVDANGAAAEMCNAVWRALAT